MNEIKKYLPDGDEFCSSHFSRHVFENIDDNKTIITMLINTTQVMDTAFSK